jgi:hypothetical protein
MGHANDDDGDGISECDGDCNDGNPSAWTEPGKVTGLVIAADKESFTWDPVSSGSSEPPAYSLFRSSRPAVFVESSCPAKAVLTNSATDASLPLPGEGFFYVVGAENGCARDASAGTWSDGTDRGASCEP